MKNNMTIEEAVEKIENILKKTNNCSWSIHFTSEENMYSMYLYKTPENKDLNEDKAAGNFLKYVRNEEGDI